MTHAYLWVRFYSFQLRPSSRSHPKNCFKDFTSLGSATHRPNVRWELFRSCRMTLLSRAVYPSAECRKKKCQMSLGVSCRKVVDHGAVWSFIGVSAFRLAVRSGCGELLQKELAEQSGAVFWLVNCVGSKENRIISKCWRAFCRYFSISRIQTCHGNWWVIVVTCGDSLWGT